MVGLACLFTGKEADAADSGAVYVMTNDAPHNSVVVYDRSDDGSLTRVQQVSTRGAGTGVTLDPLMSQGALALSPDGTLLFAVNPASGSVTSFTVTANGLAFASQVPSGGAFPVSVTSNDGVVYVLNQLGIANISGFRVSARGQLSAIPSSNRDLAGRALALPAQVSFTPDGTGLVVTEKGTHLIDTFRVLGNGRTNGPLVQKSSGRTPFGFAFGSSGALVVSEAENRLPLAATVSSYSVGSDVSLTPVSAAVPDNQTAACWVAITRDVAWVVNTGTAVISAYQVGANGSLTLLNSNAGTTGEATSPIDLAASEDGRFLYVLKSATGEIASFSINGSSLTPAAVVGGLPLSIQGIVVR